MMKNCIICNIEFKARSAIRNKCCASKICKSALRKIRLEKYRQNPEFIKKRQIACARYNRSEKRKKWIKANWNIHIKKQTAYQKKRRKIDSEFRLAGTLRRAISRVFGGEFKKTISRKDVIFYSQRELKQHLENQFKPGMSWDNYGITGWHIDHKKPMSSFSFFDEKGNVNIEQVRECMSLQNLQPLWYDENIRKGGVNRLKLVS